MLHLSAAEILCLASSKFLLPSHRHQGRGPSASTPAERTWFYSFLHDSALCIDAGRIWTSTREAGEKLLCNAQSRWDGQTLHRALQAIVRYVGSRTAKCTRLLCRRNIPLILTRALWPTYEVMGQSNAASVCWDRGDLLFLSCIFPWAVRSYRDSNDSAVGILLNAVWFGQISNSKTITTVRWTIPRE